LNLFSKLTGHTQDLFSEIEGRFPEKSLLNMALHASGPVHVLMVGPPAGGKTSFLKSIEKKYKGEVLYFNFTRTSGAGAQNDIIRNRKTVKIILADEIADADKTTRAMFLDLMENGRITFTLKNEKVDVTGLNIWVIATCNDITRIKRNQPQFLDRMQVISVKSYTEEEYYRVAKFRLTKEGVTAEIAKYIAESMYKMHNSRDLRECVRVAKMAKTEHDVDEVIRNLGKLAPIETKKKGPAE